MDPESRKLLEATLALAEENNKMLHKIRGIQKRETLWHVLKLLVIIGIAFGSFYYIEPYLNKMMDLYNSISGTQERVQSIQDNPSLKELLKRI